MNSSESTMDVAAFTEKWHKCLESRDHKLLHALLDPAVTFYSPVVWKPQEGRPLTEMYLLSAFQVLGNGAFEYKKEVHSAPYSILEFQTEVDGITIQGVDMITWNSEGAITEFKVMIRPLKAIQLVHQKMGEMLQKMMGGQ